MDGTENIEFEKAAENEADSDVNKYTQKALFISLFAADIASAIIYLITPLLSSRLPAIGEQIFSEGNHVILSEKDTFTDKDISFSIDNYRISNNNISVVMKVTNNSANDYTLTADNFEFFIFYPDIAPNKLSSQCSINTIDNVPLPAEAQSEIFLSVHSSVYSHSDDAYISVSAINPESNKKCEFLLKCTDGD